MGETREARASGRGNGSGRGGNGVTKSLRLAPLPPSLPSQLRSLDSTQSLPLKKKENCEEVFEDENVVCFSAHVMPCGAGHARHARQCTRPGAGGRYGRRRWARGGLRLANYSMLKRAVDIKSTSVLRLRAMCSDDVF